MTGTFRDWLLATDTTGVWNQIAAEQDADLAAGKTWGVFLGDQLIESRPARFMAESARDDDADATGRDPGEYEIREIEKEGND